MDTLYLKEVGQSIVYYSDAQGKNKICGNPWPDKPTKRNKYVMLNCNRYQIKWIEGI